MSANIPQKTWLMAFTVYEMWKKDKVGLKQTTRGNYIYMYEHFVKDDFGWQKLHSIRRSDVRRFYNSLVDTKKLSMATLDNIHTVVHQIFKLAVEDDYIRINPSDEMLADCKRSHNYQAAKRKSGSRYFCRHFPAII